MRLEAKFAVHVTLIGHLDSFVLWLELTSQVNVLALLPGASRAEWMALPQRRQTMKCCDNKTESNFEKASTSFRRNLPVQHRTPLWFLRMTWSIIKAIMINDRSGQGTASEILLIAYQPSPLLIRQQLSNDIDGVDCFPKELATRCLVSPRHHRWDGK